MTTIAQLSPIALPLVNTDLVPVWRNGTTFRAPAEAVFVDLNMVIIQADPTGVTDSAPAFRAAMGSNRTILLPPGTYRFKSTQAPPPAFNDPTGVLVQGFSNFRFTGYGATIIIDDSIALSSAFQFDRCQHFVVEGMTIQGTRAGLSAGEENDAITATSCVDFRFSNHHFTGNFGGNGAGFTGVWLVDGRFDNIRMDAVGQGFDFAFLQHVTFSKIFSYGADTNGAFGGGQKCFSFINDGNNQATNNTGIAFTNTDGVVVSDSYITGFNVGSFLTAGSNYLYSGNLWEGNAGTLPGSHGIGIFIEYTLSGAFSSVGVPPTNISIIGDRFVRNGTIVSGAGILIDPSQITNSDVISGLTVVGCLFANNTNAGIASLTGSLAHFSGLTLGGNLYSGVNQTTSIAAEVAAAASSVETFDTVNADTGNIDTIFSSLLEMTGPIVMPNNVAFQLQDHLGVGHPTIFGTPGDQVVFRPISSSPSAALGTQDFAGNDQFFTTNATDNPVNLRVNSTMKQVFVGAADSGGTGFRVLRVAN